MKNDSELKVYLDRLQKETDDYSNLVNDLLRRKLWKLRSQGTMTMTYFANHTGLNHAHLYQWLRGDHNLDGWKTVYKVAKVLGITIVVK